MARRKGSTTGTPEALAGLTPQMERYILENFPPACYTTKRGKVFRDPADPETQVDWWNLRESARAYAAQIAYTAQCRRLYADDGRSVRTVAPAHDWHTENPTMAELFKASGNTFAYECAKLAEADGRPYRLFRRALEAGERAQTPASAPGKAPRARAEAPARVESAPPAQTSFLAPYSAPRGGGPVDLWGRPLRRCPVVAA